jgi:hypothetical protein
VQYFQIGAPEWQGFYAMSSYNGSAGKRSFLYATMTRDGIFFLDTHIRLRDVNDGSSNTLLFGERYHRDAEYDRISRANPSLAWGIPIGDWGMWGKVHTTPTLWQPCSPPMPFTRM